MKKDIKYIIKRIIIGVGIALILGFLGKKGVLAESVPNSVCLTTNSRNDLPIAFSTNCDSDYLYNDSSINIDNNFNYYSYSNYFRNDSGYVLTNSFYNSSLELYTITQHVSTEDILFKSPYKYIGLVNTCTFDNQAYCSPNKNYDAYQYFYSKNEIDLSSNSSFDISPNNLDIIRSGRSDYIFITPNLNTYNAIWNKISYSSNNISTTIMVNNTPYYLIYSFYGVVDQDYIYGSDTSSYDSYTNFSHENNIFYFWNKDNSKNQENVSYFPNGYTEIQLQENQAVYFVPKNYNNIQIETIDNINYIDFNYWFRGSIKRGIFPLNNPESITSTFDTMNSIDNYTYVDDSIFMYENADMSGYQYYAYLIYNNKTQPTSVIYNSTLFNHYFILDMTNYQENVCTINRDNQEQCFDIRFYHTLEQIYDRGINGDNDTFISDDNGFVGETGKTINSLLDFIMSPISFVRDVFNGTCNGIDVPFIGNTSFTASCLSPPIKSAFGNYYNIIITIISALLVYHVTMQNIACVISTLSLKNDKLEVIDL